MSMNRRICSYDKVEISGDFYAIIEEQGEIYLGIPTVPSPLGDAAMAQNEMAAEMERYKANWCKRQLPYTNVRLRQKALEG